MFKEIDSGKKASKAALPKHQNNGKKYFKDNRPKNTVQKKANDTGLPDNLKSGIENLSGHSMDDVKVHYNSDKPAQLNAHAYAQGTDIHVASGQEKHLAHEAWHVVQQKQGRVRPTAQMKGKVNVNDDTALEKEADTMGAKAVSLPGTFHTETKTSKGTSGNVVQRVGGVTSGYDATSIAKPAFQANVKLLFDVARRLNKLKKQIVTKENHDALTANVVAKGPQVKGTYAAALTTVNLDPAWLRAVGTNAASIDALLNKARLLNFILPGEVALVKADIQKLVQGVNVDTATKKIKDKTWKVGDVGPQPEVAILTGAAAFEKKADKNVLGGIHRDIFKKRGKDDGDNNEYVKDDFGNYVRRYAHMEKGYHQWMSYKEDGFLTGKTQELVGAATGVKADTVNPTDFGNQHLTADEDALQHQYGNTNKTLAYMHQWKGSGPGQRGLSLASTGKDDAVFGNSGEPFKSADGAKFKLDLARVNPANNIMLSHYGPESPTRSGMADQTGAGAFDRKLTSGSKSYQYERSVIKNREIYLQKVTPDIVVNVTMNNVNHDLNRDSALFIQAKKDAIKNINIQHDIDLLKASKVRLESDVQRLTRNRASAIRDENDADDQERANDNLRNEARSNNRERVFPGMRHPMRPTLYYAHKVRDWRKKKLQYRERKEDLTVRLSDVTGRVAQCQDEIDALTLQLVAKPNVADKHGSEGWASGKSYMEGYKEGLRVKTRIGTNNRAKIKELTSEAYKNHDKFMPYWQGYGAALNS